MQRTVDPAAVPEGRTVTRFRLSWLRWSSYAAVARPAAAVC
jgi:hypothetical protein